MKRIFYGIFCAAFAALSCSGCSIWEKKVEPKIKEVKGHVDHLKRIPVIEEKIDMANARLSVIERKLMEADDAER